MASTVKYKDLTLAVHEVLPEFACWKNNYAKGAAHKIVKIIFRSIIEALRRGEKVEIEGLGTLRLTPHKTHRIGITYTYGKITPHATKSTMDLKPHLVVTFKPTPSILTTINKETPIDVIP